MQIIQGIRDKGAAIVIVVIALSLIGFILMDAKQGTSRLFSSNTAALGKVNGSSIEQSDFNKRVKQEEDMQEQRSGRKSTVAETAQIREQVWNQMVAEKVFYAEADKLGINFTSKELSAILSTNDQSNPLIQEPGMVDQTTGRLDEAKVKEALITIKKSKGDQFEIINSRIVEPQKIGSISTKYIALLNATAYYPAWMEEKDKKENKEFANISYVAVPYGVINDSTVKVSDEEIEKYVQKHKDLFKQEEGRMISYVAFSSLPNSDDSATTRDAVAKLKNGFTTEPNVKTFLARNTSIIEFDSNYLPKSKITSTSLDSIIKLPTGSVYGPYVDRGSFVLAKLLGSKTLPDSVKCRHILIKMADKSGQKREDSIARKLVDSIALAIKNGADFNQMVLKYSDDDGSKNTKGEYKFSSSSQLVDSFYNTVFYNPTGTKKIVKGQSQDYVGYHYIEVLDQWKFNPAYKIAFMAKEILASEATINKASLDATKLSAEKDATKFDAYVQKNGIRKITLPAIIKENDASIGQLQEARSLVRWVFEAKKGDVSDPFSIGDQFVVAVVDKILKEGTQDVQTAKAMAEPAIRDEKKADLIVKKLGNITTLESAANIYNSKVLTAGADSSIMFTARIINNIGTEPKLIGACFNKENQTKVSSPILGKTSVYLVKVNSIGAKADDSPEKLAQRRIQQTDELRNTSVNNWFDGLKKQASIKDNRSTFY